MKTALVIRMMKTTALGIRMLKMIALVIGIMMTVLVKMLRHTLPGDGNF
jgi:hypothetical protein